MINIKFWTAVKLGFGFTIGSLLALPALLFVVALLGIGGMSL